MEASTGGLSSYNSSSDSTLFCCCPCVSKTVDKNVDMPGDSKLSSDQQLNHLLTRMDNEVDALLTRVKDWADAPSEEFQKCSSKPKKKENNEHQVQAVSESGNDLVDGHANENSVRSVTALVQDLQEEKQLTDCGIGICTENISKSAIPNEEMSNELPQGTPNNAEDDDYGGHI